MNRVPDLSWLGARCILCIPVLCRGRESFILAALILILIEMLVDLERKSCARYRKLHVDAPHGVATNMTYVTWHSSFYHLLSRQPQLVLPSQLEQRLLNAVTPRLPDHRTAQHTLTAAEVLARVQLYILCRVVEAMLPELTFRNRPPLAIRCPKQAIPPKIFAC